LLLKRQSRAPELVRLINNSPAMSPSGFPLLTDFAGRAALLEEPANEGLDAWEHSFMTWLDSAANPLQRASAADLETWLPDDLLIKFDRMAMAQSLEGRAPYLTPDLVNAALHLPDEERMANGKSKIALRRIAQQWLPPNILARRKQGFVLPMKHWITQWFVLHGGAAAYLANHAIPGLNARRVLSLVQADLQAGVQRERLLFALLLLFEWYSAAQIRIGTLRKAYVADRNSVH
jgi:asparagine synthase (glutamine-hydrolysing)